MFTSWHCLRPLWIDSLYGSNNSNLPSMYDESYARLPRSNATTTNEYHTVSYIPPAPPLPPFMQTSAESKEYSLTNACFTETSRADTQTSDVKLTEQRRTTDEDISMMRRIRSDGNILSTNHDSNAEHRFKKKSKSMMENLCTIPDELQQEPSAIVKANEPIVETRVESFSAMDLPIDDWRPILQILENVFADEELRSSEQLSEKPESREPLLSNKGSYSNDHRHHCHSSKSIEQRNESESHLSTRFRRSNSNQGGRRRRTATRRATCTFSDADRLLDTENFRLLAVDQQQPYLNDEASSKGQSRLSSSYRQAATTTVLKGNIDGWFMNDDRCFSRLETCFDGCKIFAVCGGDKFDQTSLYLFSSSVTGWIQFTWRVSDDDTVRWIVAVDLTHYGSTSVDTCLSFKVTSRSLLNRTRLFLSAARMMEIRHLKSSMKSNGTTKRVRALCIIFETKMVGRHWHSHPDSTICLRVL